MAEKLQSTSFRVPPSLIERMKNAAYWTRVSINSIGIDAIETEVKRLEKLNGGKKFADRPKK